MGAIAADIRILLVRELEAFAREIEMFPDDALLWKTVPGVANSAGNLALHVSGNLQHFVGRALGMTAYARRRDLEFSRKDGTRAEVVREIRAAIAVVRDTLPALSDEILAREYPEPVGGVRMRTGLFLAHLSAHLAFHLGQAGYLRRVLTGDGRTSGSVGLEALASEP
jgi:hypothetical protein